MSKEIPDMRPIMEVIKKATEMPLDKIPGFGWGTVKTLSPLTIASTNGLEITEDFLCKSPFCEKWTTKRLEHLHKYNVSHNHTVKVKEDEEEVEKTTSTEMTQDRETQKSISTFTFWRGLQVGDKVCYLRINNSQMFIILWREKQFDLEV